MHGNVSQASFNVQNRGLNSLHTGCGEDVSKFDRLCRVLDREIDRRVDARDQRWNYTAIREGRDHCSRVLDANRLAAIVGWRV